MPGLWDPGTMLKTLAGGAMIAFWFVTRGGFRRGPNMAGYDIPVPEAPTGPDLLARSNRAGRALDVTQERCFWPTDEQALFLRLNPGDPSYHAVLQDRAGRETPLERFNSRYGARLQGLSVVLVMEGGEPEPAKLSPPDAELSPDGEWLLWHEHRNGAPANWIAARLDGSNERTWPSGILAMWSKGGVAWCRASNRWVELQQSPRWGRYVVT